MKISINDDITLNVPAIIMVKNISLGISSIEKDDVFTLSYGSPLKVTFHKHGRLYPCKKIFYPPYTDDSLKEYLKELALSVLA